MLTRRIHFRGSRSMTALLVAGCVAMALICMSALSSSTGQHSRGGGGGGGLLLAEAAPANEEANSMLNQAKKFLDSGRQNTQTTTGNTSNRSQQLSLLSTSTERDPRLERELRQSIKVATDLINNYRQNGLSSLPSLPNLPGVGTVMRLPDKLLRAELSMIQDEIRMAMEMMNNPLAATMNAPKDIAAMFYRMAEQLEQ